MLLCLHGQQVDPVVLMEASSEVLEPNTPSALQSDGLVPSGLGDDSKLEWLALWIHQPGSFLLLRTARGYCIQTGHSLQTITFNTCHSLCTVKLGNLLALDIPSISRAAIWFMVQRSRYTTCTGGFKFRLASSTLTPRTHRIS